MSLHEIRLSPNLYEMRFMCTRHMGYYSAVIWHFFIRLSQAGACLRGPTGSDEFRLFDYINSLFEKQQSEKYSSEKRETRRLFTELLFQFSRVTPTLQLSEIMTIPNVQFHTGTYEKR